MKAPNEAERCEVCDWPYEQTGCQPGDCSYRPHEGTAEYQRIQQRRAQLKAKTESYPELSEKGKP